MLNNNEIAKGPIYRKRKNYDVKYVACCSIMLLGTTLVIGLFTTGVIKPKVPYIIYAIGVVPIVTVVVFIAIRRLLKPSNKVEIKTHQVDVNDSYMGELKGRFNDINFKYLKKSKGMYVTNHKNRSTWNDGRIFI
ncbi:hypothetical protein [Candidatus Mesenet endosymbiont of Agriotes lineatus]|uniref:hypothetical protein n=1 Tax=Candidatus Mesenet endosymbiont of Agriotes lineatus TaxID=3077948 RepID=UPI0030D4E4F6